MLNLTHCANVAKSLEEPTLTEAQIKQFERWRTWRRTELRVMEIQYNQLLHLGKTQDMLVLHWTTKR